MTTEVEKGADSSINVPVLIVGAGPTGLVLALWLTQLGIRVRIIDKTSEPGTTSRALAVQARTLEFYHQMNIDQANLAQQVVDAGVKVEGVNLWVRAARAARVPLGNIGKRFTPFPFALIFPQDAHERLLIDRLAALGVHVERRTELVRFDQQADGVRAVLKRSDGAEETCLAAYLAGCDGASSVVRQALGIGFPGGTYSGLFYVADVEASGPVTNYELHVDLDESDLLIVFPLKGQDCVRLVGSLREVPGRGDHELTFEDVSRRAIEHLQLRVGKVNWFSTYRVHHRVAQRFGDGRAFLLGDAAHIHSPVGGQGMNTGIGDAVNLAWKLAAVLGGADQRVLDTYETERIGFARRLVVTTDQGFTFVTAQGWLARFVRTRLVPILLPWLFRMGAMRRLLFRTVSQVNIRYRASALGAGRAGSIHGGDRLPWIETAPGMDNFAALASLAWQVHVYGQPRSGLAEACRQLGLPLHAFAWRTEMRQSGVARDALYLIRPDGYVALADRHGSPESLRRYLADQRVIGGRPLGQDLPAGTRA